MKILKFGGSSVADGDRINHVAEIITRYREEGVECAVVVSALGGVTDMLIGMSESAAKGDFTYKEVLDRYTERHFEVVEKLISEKHQEIVKYALRESHIELANILQGIFLIRELSKRTLDNILSHGERSSAFILSEVLRDRNIVAHYLDARKVVLTDSHFGAARVNSDETNKRIQAHFASNKGIAIITGFIASNDENVTTTLGRGGSDYTASFFASALDAEMVEIWTDVNGVLTADPRKVKQAFSVERMTYEEAMEMSHFGAKVIYPPTILPAMVKRIPIVIKNTFNPDHPGTLIDEHGSKDDKHPVKGVASISNVSIFTLEGSGLFGVSGSNLIARLFNILAAEQINVILITQGSSEHALCFAIAPEQVAKARAAIDKEFALEIKAGLIQPLRLDEQLSVISVVGEKMKSRPGISGKLFQSLGRNGVNVMLTVQGSSERNITVVIEREDESKALNAVHEAFFLSDTFSLNLFIVGVGLIGKTLLEQIKENAAFMHDQQFIDLNVVALSNSKTMLFDEDGIDLQNWPAQLKASPLKADTKAFVDNMIEMNLPNSIFVDNTANDSIPDYYGEILENSISISTPNKVAASGKYEDYFKLKSTADSRGVYYAYETNVGAGLPVITTIADLVNSGDRIEKIEGVLSGSLSFIFNNYTAGKKFSQIVGEAREKGFTEPDPREDLSGKDVARKLLILAREAGIKMETEAIRIDGILPKACLEAPTVDAFMEALEAADGEFEQRRAAAEAEGKSLRFIATLEGEDAFISLQAVGADSPFTTLSGSDNMIVFTTKRYHERPLVIKGPGAGAEVTAAGVFAEILRIANQLSPVLRLG
ncbi:MAG: bifunctional aspartate kinase/homoserine dehydrogenase I [Bacteroidia bacterium]